VLGGRLEYLHYKVRICTAAPSQHNTLIIVECMQIRMSAAPTRAHPWTTPTAPASPRQHPSQGSPAAATPVTSGTATRVRVRQLQCLYRVFVLFCTCPAAAVDSKEFGAGICCQQHRVCGWCDAADPDECNPNNCGALPNTDGSCQPKAAPESGYTCGCAPGYTWTIDQCAGECTTCCRWLHLVCHSRSTLWSVCLPPCTRVHQYVVRST
jgi:hypothetical protein